MSNQNNDNSGIAVAFAFIGAAMFFMAAVIFAVAAFASVVFTIAALCAWNKPITVFGEVMEPHEARAFVKRGLLGMVLAPLFVLFCSAMFELPIVDDAWGFIIVGGYTLGSIGIEYLKLQGQQNGAATYIPPAPPASLPPPAVPPRDNRQPREPFTFADWDDEERPR